MTVAPVRRKVGKHIVHRRVRRFASSELTLDLGCGRHSTYVDDFSRRVGVDICHDEGVDVVADAHALPFSSGSFEQLVCSEVLEHLAHPQQAASEMARVLRHGGRLVLTTPFVYPLHEAPHDYWRLTSYGLHQLFDPYFEIRELQDLYSEEETLAILLQRVAFQRRGAPVRRYAYMLLAHLIFRFVSAPRARRFQDIGQTVEGPFLTAGYILVAHKRDRDNG